MDRRYIEWIVSIVAAIGVCSPIILALIVGINRIDVEASLKTKRCQLIEIALEESVDLAPSWYTEATAALKGCL